MQWIILRQLLNLAAFTSAIFVLSLDVAPRLFGQERSVPAKPDNQPAQNGPIEILDEPKTVDPATLVSPQLAAPVTVRFDGDPLKKVFTWLQQDQSINVLVDYKALASARLLDTDPVYEELSDAPLYLLLNRLEHMGLAWYEQDNSLLITSRVEYLKHDRTISYNLGDFFDAGYLPQDLLTTIKRGSGGQWGMSNGMEGAAVLLGDVVFIRQTDDIHREIAGLLSALRTHSRRTLTLDTPRHDLLRAALQQKIDVDFQETPLVAAAQELSRLTQISIRIDRAAVTKGQVRERTPVTLKLADQKLGAVLRSLLSNLGLSWYLRDDVLWISSYEAVGEFHKTAVYDVRDLCADKSESIALKNAIESQTRAKWRVGIDTGGVLETPKPGVLVVRHSETAIDDVLQLLENYRTALNASKLRIEPEPDPAEVITGYYRLRHLMAKDLQNELPDLILPKTWQSEENPDAAGTTLTIAAETSPPDAKGNVVQYDVLVIRQSRAAHKMIGKLIQTLIDSKPVDPEVGIDTKKSEKQPVTFGRNLISKPVESSK